MCGTFKSDPSAPLQHCGRKGGEGIRTLDAVVPEVLLSPRCWVTAVVFAGGPAARRKKMEFEEDIGEFGVQLPPPTAVRKLLR